MSRTLRRLAVVPSLVPAVLAAFGWTLGVAAPPPPPAPGANVDADEDLLEFLGGVGGEDADFADFLARTDIAQAAKTPPKPAPAATPAPPPTPSSEVNKS